MSVLERRPNLRHPGWPDRPGPIRVPAGLVRLRPVRLRDAGEWSSMRIRDEAQLVPWEPAGVGTWRSRNSAATWPMLCSAMRGAARRGLLLPFAIEVDGAFAGQITIGNVVRGALRSAWVGYWVSTSFTGRGVATAAVALALDHSFGPVGLHRVEATVRPENLASRSVLARVGFREEGLLRKYLDVDGAWRDHLLVAMTEDEIPGSVTAALVHSGRAQWA
ncbi:MAG: GNAT family N-acetyltransferase [Mycobacteriaceae bacterium]